MIDIFAPNPNHRHAKLDDLWAYRMAFADANNDPTARHIVMAEIGDCTRCWRIVAWALSCLVGEALTNTAQVFTGTTEASGTAFAVGYLEKTLADALGHTLPDDDD
jgi:hypothetical protein